MLNGIINVYKEANFTSFDVVAVMRGITGTRKVGHTGTLDPMATGVLPICIGSATALCDMLTDKRKEYVASFLLGKETDTLDISGEVLRQKEVAVDAPTLETAIRSFIGEYDQLPPMYSAKKVDGKRLYDLARAGKEVIRKPQRVEIFDIEILSMNIPEFTVRVKCGKGTYIRSLGADIAAKCGELAVMTSLERTASGQFEASSSHTLEELTAIKNAGDLESVLIPVDQVFADLERINTDIATDKYLYNGNKLRPDNFQGVTFSDGQEVRLYDSKGEFKAVYVFRSSEDMLVPRKMFL